MKDGAIRAVLFDAGQTLLRVGSSVGTVYAEAAARRGLDVSPRELDARFVTAWRRSLARSRSRGYRCSDAILREEWREIVRETFPPDSPPDRIRATFEDLHARFSSAEAWTLARGARETLSVLRLLGVRVGLLSNWDSRLPRVLEEIGIRPCFDFLVISYEVGLEKPHPEIFRVALERAGTAPWETLHVGDSPEADILPARKMGLRTLWIASAEEIAASPELEPAAAELPEPAEPFWRQWLSAPARRLGRRSAEEA